MAWDKQGAPFVAVFNLMLAMICDHERNQPKDTAMPNISDYVAADFGRNSARDLGRPLAIPTVRNATMLIVEDSRYSCEVLRLYCRQLGIRLRRAADLGQAQAHLRLYRPDIVLVDLGLPDGRGEGLISQMVGGAHRPPLIIATSGDDSARGMAIAAGADLFLDKPLPDLTEFRALLVDHYPAALPLALLPNRPFRPEADALALQDDLAMAERCLTKADDLPYVTGFVAGVAGSAGDQELHRIARANQTDVRVLRDILQDRLRNLGRAL